MVEELDSTQLAEVAGACFCRQARMAARRITRVYDEALRPVGLKVTQFTLLVALAHETPGSITGLAEWLGMERTTLTRNLQLLQREGLVTVGRGEGRAHRASVTDDGRALLARAYPLWERAQQHVRSQLGEEQAEEVGHALRRVGRAM